MQESFLHVWKKLDSYDTSQNFSTWLYTVARNRTIDRLREQKKEIKTQQYQLKEEDVT